VTAAEEQLRQQEVDEDHRGHAARLAHHRDPDHDRQHTDDHRALRPPYHSRPDVTPEFVSAEVVGGAGALQHLTVILLHRVIAGEEWRQERYQKHDKYHHSAHGGQAIVPQLRGSVLEEVPEARPASHRGGLSEVVKPHRRKGGRGYNSLCHVSSPYRRPRPDECAGSTSDRRGRRADSPPRSLWQG